MVSLSILWISFSATRVGAGAEVGLEREDPISSPTFGRVESSSLDGGLDGIGGVWRVFLREVFCLNGEGIISMVASNMRPRE